ncbi:calmodulin-binding protein [Gossypium australe]|uniref:Calmodulin-binding protein n=1 Tax=Gossypium australe TaxID=47621 RepID=A0A5B6WLU9_9ROSI|nr:calmodulin-binding protein [Gossypium australe]
MAMEIQVMTPIPSMEFNFDSACSSPYMTAPSSPQRFGNFLYSVPTTPTRVSSFYPHLKNDGRAVDGGCEGGEGGGSEDFEFNFIGQLEKTPLSADELFDGGKIRPLKPQQLDPFEPAMEESRKRVTLLNTVHKKSRSLSSFGVSDDIIMLETEQNSSKSQKFNAKSSVFSIFSLPKGNKKWKLKDLLLFRSKSESRTTISEEPVLCRKNISYRSTESIGSVSSSRRRGPVSAHELNHDVLYGKEPEDVKNASFRSTESIGSVSRPRRGPDSAHEKEPEDVQSASFRSTESISSVSVHELNCAVLSRIESEDVKNASFRSTESISSVSNSRRRGPVSAHELHYTKNRAVSEEMRRKTFLPYKKGLLGCLGFNAGCGIHEISRGIGSLTRG